jgi:hypothetical protein
MGKEVSVGVKYKNSDVFHTSGLKNPLSGFFTKTADGKKQKIILANLSSNIADKLKSTLKKNNVTPPPGMKLNPKTGRFVKDREVEKDEKTFVDPISLNKMKKTAGVELNKQWYSKNGLQKWINSGKNTIPHSRRKFTNAEMNVIFTDKKGKKIERVVNSNSNNFNSNENYNSNDNTRWGIFNLANTLPVESGAVKTFATFEQFKEYIEGISEYLAQNDLGGLKDIKITIQSKPGVTIMLNVVNMGVGYRNDYDTRAEFELKILPSGREVFGTELDTQYFVREVRDALR